jgi:hypothetical protein
VTWRIIRIGGNFIRRKYANIIQFFHIVDKIIKLLRLKSSIGWRAMVIVF